MYDYVMSSKERGRRSFGRLKSSFFLPRWSIFDLGPAIRNFCGGFCGGGVCGEWDAVVTLRILLVAMSMSRLCPGAR